jgi:RimJ/RimL family protein N-acetyltransferase
VTNTLGLRSAVLEDAERIYLWRNDPFIVARSSSQRTVDWNEHLLWFSEALRNNARLILIVQLENCPIGLVRFDRYDAMSAVISVYLMEKHTGRGYGLEVIRRGCRTVFERWDVSRVTAHVRSDNAPAQSAFMKAGFCSDSSGSRCPAGHVSLSLFRQVRQSSQHV